MNNFDHNKWIKDFKSGKFLKESLNEADEIGGYYLMNILKDLAVDSRKSGETKMADAYTYLHDRINQSYRDIDLNQDDIKDLLNEPQGRKHINNLPDWAIEDLFTESVNEAASDRFLQSAARNLAKQMRGKSASRTTLMNRLNSMPLANRIKPDELDKIVDYAMQEMGLTEAEEGMDLQSLISDYIEEVNRVADELRDLEQYVAGGIDRYADETGDYRLEQTRNQTARYIQSAERNLDALLKMLERTKKFNV